MAGIRGFSDPNVQINPGDLPVWYQPVNSSITNATDYLLPWYLNYLGGNWSAATQCMVAGDNGWNGEPSRPSDPRNSPESNHHFSKDNHAALNGDLNNKWALNNTPWSWGHFSRQELPVHFGIAEGWTIGDMYQVGLNPRQHSKRLNYSGIRHCLNKPKPSVLGKWLYQRTRLSSVV
jgi:phospholipase C